MRLPPDTGAAVGAVVTGLEDEGVSEGICENKNETNEKQADDRLKRLTRENT